MRDLIHPVRTSMSLNDGRRRSRYRYFSADPPRFPPTHSIGNAGLRLLRIMSARTITSISPVSRPGEPSLPAGAHGPVPRERIRSGFLPPHGIRTSLRIENDLGDSYVTQAMKITPPRSSGYPPSLTSRCAPISWARSSHRCVRLE